MLIYLIFSLFITITTESINAQLTPESVPVKKKSTPLSAPYYIPSSIKPPASLFTPPSKAHENNPFFTEDFEALINPDFAAGWTGNPVPQMAYGSWIPDINAGFFAGNLICHSGNKCAGALTAYKNDSGYSENMNAWLWTPGFALNAGTYTLKFYLKCGFTYGTTVYEKFRVRIGKEANVEEMITGTTIYTLPNLTDYIQWKEIVVEFAIEETGTYYIGFNAYTTIPSGGQGGCIAIDDVSLSNPTSRMNDLSISAKYVLPYTKVPVGDLAQTIQLTPADAIVSNVGVSTQTNVSVAVEFNGSTLETSAPVASLTPTSLKAVKFSTQANLTAPAAIGEKQTAQFKYTVSSDAADSDESDNTVTISDSLIGTLNLLSQNAATPATGLNLYNGSVGNIFTITNEVTLSQVHVGLLMSGEPLDYSVSLYKANSTFDKVERTALFTIDATRPAGNYGSYRIFTHNVPAATILTPGNYFLCVDQLTDVSAGLLVDMIAPKKIYGLKRNDTNLVSYDDLGAAFLEMIFATNNCPYTASNLQVSDITFRTATFTWDGDAPYNYTFEIYKKADNSLVASGDGISSPLYLSSDYLSPNTTYYWKVYAKCDAQNSGDILTGAEFTTEAGVYDLELYEITGIESGINMSDSNTVSVGIFDYSTINLTATDTVFVILEIDGIIKKESSITGNDFWYDSDYPVAYCYFHRQDFSTEGKHTVKVYIRFAKDNNFGNDTLSTTITNTIYDLGVTGITSHQDGKEYTKLSSAEVIKIKVKNYNNTVKRNPVNVLYTISLAHASSNASNNSNASNETNETLTSNSESIFSITTDSLDINEEREFTFTAKADLSEYGTYTIKAFIADNNIDNNSSNDTATITIINKLDVAIEDETQSDKIKIYPNPASSKLSIVSSEKIKKVEVLNILGGLIKEYNSSVSNISVRHLKAGAYLLRITTEKSISTQRFIKK